LVPSLPGRATMIAIIRIGIVAQLLSWVSGFSTTSHAPIMGVQKNFVNNNVGKRWLQPNSKNPESIESDNAQSPDIIGSDETTETKSMSPLAMAAADWLEEEEDELSLYWEKFDDAKRNGIDNKSRVATATTELLMVDEKNVSPVAITTEELLDRYYESRGISRKTEQKHEQEIKDAVKAARKASSAEEAIRRLEGVKSYLQCNTQLGGNALLELAECYEANEEPEKAMDIYEKVRTNPQSQIRRRVKAIFTNPTSRPKRQFTKGLWNLTWDKWF
jgi:tetratricopeptide (TPR) repeat protein